MISLVASVGVLAVIAPSIPVAAVDVFSGCTADSNAAVCKSTGDDATKSIQNVINILLYILGIIAVIMIIIGGIRYALSGGDSGSTKSAKDTILYSVIGLVVAILSYSIINLVIDRFR